MADKFLSKTGFIYYHNRIKNLFARKDALETLDAKVEDIIAEGGEPNVIETIRVNGAALSPDAQKAVDISVPTATSQLTNDSDFATEGYVDEHGGKIDIIQVNGTAQPITNKTVDIAVPEAVSELTNDSGYQTEAQVQALIDSELEGITGIDFEVVDSLPATGKKGVIYLVHKGGTAADIYDEFIWVTPTSGSAHFEQIGTTDIDLSDYWSKTELEAITTAEIDEIMGA